MQDCGSTSSTHLIIIHFFPLQDCGTAGALVLHPFNIHIYQLRNCGSTSSTLISYSDLSTISSTFIIIDLTVGLWEQAINVTPSWRGILKLLQNIFHINFTRSLTFQWKLLVMAKHGELFESKSLVYVQPLITRLCPLMYTNTDSSCTIASLR